MKIGIIKETKTPPDKRVALTPKDCHTISEKYKEITFKVEESVIRKISDSDYEKYGIEVSKNLNECDLLIGVKEVKIEHLIKEKTYLFFSHTTKMQPYNKELLKNILDKKITLIDYELLVDEKNKRLVGFGKYAGIIGCYNILYAIGEKQKKFELKRAFNLNKIEELYEELNKVRLPKDFKILITGTGKVSIGAKQILNKIGIKEILDSSAFINETFEEPVFCNINTNQYAKTSIKNANFYTHPELFENDFQRFSKITDVFIAGHFWSDKAPKMLTNNDLLNSKIKFIADISCDIKGPIASTTRASSIKEPLYGYNPKTKKETDIKDPNSIVVMAVDNLPCELPKNASEEFSQMLCSVVPEFLLPKSNILERATVCKNGILTKNYQYLKDFCYS